MIIAFSFAVGLGVGAVIWTVALRTIFPRIEPTSITTARLSIESDQHREAEYRNWISRWYPGSRRPA